MQCPQQHINQIFEYDEALAGSPTPPTLKRFCSAIHWSNLTCMYNQLSQDILLALLTLTAIYGVNHALQLSHVGNVFLVCPNRFAASVTVKPSGFITSSRNSSSGWLYFLNVIPQSHLLIIKASIINFRCISGSLSRNMTPKFPATHTDRVPFSQRR